MINILNKWASFPPLFCLPLLLFLVFSTCLLISATPQDFHFHQQSSRTHANTRTSHTQRPTSNNSTSLSRLETPAVTCGIHPAALSWQVPQLLTGTNLMVLLLLWALKKPRLPFCVSVRLWENEFIKLIHTR